MKDARRTKAQLLDETRALRVRVAELESALEQCERDRQEAGVCRRRLQMILDSSLDGINITRWDPVTRLKKLVYFNDRYVEMSGRTREELEKVEDASELSTPVQSGERPARNFSALLKGIPVRGTASYKRPDGRENYFEWSAVGVKVGDTFELIGIDRDVTEQRKVEQALRQSERRLRSIVENAYVGINVCEMDPNTGAKRLMLCNDRYAEMSGYTREELMSAENILDLQCNGVILAGDDPRSVDPAHFTPGQRIRGRVSWRRPDGRANTVEWSASYFVEGEKIRLVGIDRDVTERTEMEDALRESEHRLRTIIDNAYDGISIQEHDFVVGKVRLIECNRRYVEMSGRSREELMAADNLLDLTSTRITTAAGEDSDVALRAGRPARGTSVWTLPDGDERVFEWTAVPLQRGDRIQVIGIDRDVTERKHLEDELRRSEERLRLIVDNAHDGINIMEFDPATEKTKLIFCNDRFAEMSGRSKEELLARGDLTGLTTALHVNDEPDVVECWLKGVPVSGMSSWHRPDGKENVFGWTGVPCRVGDVIHIIGIDRDITEQRKAEEEVRESERRLRAILDNAYDGISICEIDPVADTRKMLYCNDRYIEMSGRTRQELEKAEDISSWGYSLQSQVEAEESYERLLKGLPATGKGSWLRPDGKDNVFEWSATAVKKGDRYEFIGIDRDVTERERMTQALRESEERFRLFADSVSDGLNIQQFDPATGKRRLVYCNDRYVEMSGYTREELEAADNLAALLLSYDLKLPSPLRDMLDGEPATGSESWKRPDGKENFFEWTGVAVKRGDKHLLFGIDRDVTEQKKVREALRESEQRLRLIVENAFDGINICRLDPATGRKKLVFCNDRYVEMSGYAREQLMAAEDIPQLQTYIPSGTHKGHLYERLMRGESASGFSSWNRPDGKENVFEWSAAPFEAGGKLYVVGVDRDVTERRRLEHQLTQAQKMQAIGELAGGVAHDFNNLLTAILGYANLLRSEAEPGTLVSEAAVTIEKAAERAAELTAQLLGLARRGKHLNVSVDLHDTIKEVVKLLSRTLDRNIRIAEHLRAEECVVPGDPGQLQQMILNLTVNARDAMPDGGELAFETVVADLDGEYCRRHAGLVPGHYLLTNITDTGHGMTDEVVERVFEPFFTTKEVGEGTGMGLAMVYGIVKNHGGYIAVYSEPGHGTTFSVYLPVGAAEADTADDEEDSLPHGTGLILLVDDEEVVRAVAARMLTTLGYTVVTAVDGKEGVERYSELGDEIDLVIVDMVMPVMDGRQCFHALKRINPEVKVLLATGYGRDGRAQELLDKGVVGFVQKPFNTARLGQAVADALVPEL